MIFKTMTQGVSVNEEGRRSKEKREGKGRERREGKKTDQGWD